MTYKLDPSNHESIIRRARELIKTTTGNEDYSLCKDRNDDLTALAFALLVSGESIFTKENIICAYLLGRRDARRPLIVRVTEEV